MCYEAKASFLLLPLIRTSFLDCQVCADFQCWQNKGRKITQPRRLLTCILFCCCMFVSSSLFKSGSNCNDTILIFSHQKKSGENSLAVQWLRLHTSTAGGTGLMSGQGIKIPYGARPGQKNFFLFKKTKRVAAFSSTWVFCLISVTGDRSFVHKHAGYRTPSETAQSF